MQEEDTPTQGGARECAPEFPSENAAQAPQSGPSLPGELATGQPGTAAAPEPAPEPGGGELPPDEPVGEAPAASETPAGPAAPDVAPAVDAAEIEEIMAGGEASPGQPAWTPEELLLPEAEASAASPALQELRGLIEAIVYVTEEPVTVAQLAASLERPKELVQQVLADLTAEYEKPEHGIAIREVAGGYKMATKPEHHEAVRAFARSLKPPLKLSLAALETLAVIAYKQPVTAPEIMEIRGVQGAGVLKTLLDRKLIMAAGRKNVIGKPVLYKTTREFLVQFGLKDLSELPTLKEFEEIRRLSIPDAAGEIDAPAAETSAPAAPPVEEIAPEEANG